MFRLIVLSFITLLSLSVYAATPETSYVEFFKYLFENIGGFKGASSLGVALLVSQILVKLFETKVGTLIGKYKLTIVSLLTLVTGVLSMSITSGVSPVTALFSSANVVLAQTFIHQVYKQFFVKED